MPRQLAALFALVLCIGCKTVNDLNATIRTAADTVQATAAKLGDDLKTATGNIDPFAVKRLLDESATLRQQLVELEKRTGQFGPSIGVIQLSGARLLLRVENYRGDFALYGYADDEAVWVFNPLTLSNANAARLDEHSTITLNTGEAYASYVNFANVPNDCEHTATNTCGTVYYTIQSFAIPKFKEFIKSTVAAKEARQLDLQNQLPPGDHWITLYVVPQAIDPLTKDWFMRIQLIQRFPDGGEQILRTADWSSTLDADTPLSTPVKRRLILAIRTAAGPG